MCIFFNISCFFKFLQALHESLYRVETGNYDYRYDFAFISIAPCKHRNGRNIAQYCWMLLVLSVCTPCCMLLRVVGSCYAKFETSRTFEPTTPNICFVLWLPKHEQQCWIRLHGSSNIVQATHMHYTWLTKSYGLYPFLGAFGFEHCWELLHPFPHHYQQGCNCS